MAVGYECDRCGLLFQGRAANHTKEWQTAHSDHPRFGVSVRVGLLGPYSWRPPEKADICEGCLTEILVEIFSKG